MTSRLFQGAESSIGLVFRFQISDRQTGKMLSEMLQGSYDKEKTRGETVCDVTTPAVDEALRSGLDLLILVLHGFADGVRFRTWGKCLNLIGFKSNRKETEMTREVSELSRLLLTKTYCLPSKMRAKVSGAKTDQRGRWQHLHAAAEQR